MDRLLLSWLTLEALNPCRSKTCFAIPASSRHHVGKLCEHKGIQVNVKIGTPPRMALFYMYFFFPMDIVPCASTCRLQDSTSSRLKISVWSLYEKISP